MSYLAMTVGIKWSTVNKQKKSWKNPRTLSSNKHFKNECEKLKRFFGLNIIANLSITTGEVTHHNFISNFHW